jgi:hypothetical protein
MELGREQRACQAHLRSQFHVPPVKNWPAGFVHETHRASRSSRPHAVALGPTIRDLLANSSAVEENRACDGLAQSAQCDRPALRGSVSWHRHDDGLVLFVIAWGIPFFVFTLGVRLLATMASGGAFGSGRSSHAYVAAQLCVTVALVWLVIGIPYRAFRLRLDPEGRGHAFTIPVYRFVAAACWTHGVGGMFSPRRAFERWRKMLPELQMARDRARGPSRQPQPYRAPAATVPGESGNLSLAQGRTHLGAVAAKPATGGKAVPSAGGRTGRRARKRARRAGGAARS